VLFQILIPVYYSILGESRIDFPTQKNIFFRERGSFYRNKNGSRIIKILLRKVLQTDLDQRL
jgi:hypothetical protein